MVHDIVLQVAQREDFQPLAPWLVALAQTPTQHCLHTWSGQDADALRDQWLAYWEASELCYILAWQADQLGGRKPDVGNHHEVQP